MDSGIVEAFEEKMALDSDSIKKMAITDDFEEEEDEKEVISYGDLILLGYNGSLESSRPSSHGRKHRSKMSLDQRPACFRFHIFKLFAL